MKRDGFWRLVGPPVNLAGVPLPFTLIYVFWFPYPSTTTIYVCTGVIAFFVVLDKMGWSVRALCTRLLCTLRGKTASGRPWWYRHFIEAPRDHSQL